MSGNILWKFVLSAAIVAWAALNLTPLRDQPFKAYVVEEASAKQDKLRGLVEDAEAMAREGEAPSVFMALRELGRKREINYAEFFPHKDVRDIANRNKRNEVLLKHLLNTSRSNLQLGLDLKGGVGFTLKIDPKALEDLSSMQQEEQLSKAIEIMSERLDGLGVSEPLIRAKGEKAIEIRLAGLSLEDNPRLIEEISKPAKLEFRKVHPTMDPENTDPENYPVGYEVLRMERTDDETGEIYEVPMFVKKIPEATGEIIDQAVARQTQTGGFEIALRMTDEGADVLRRVTETMAPDPPEKRRGDPLAIVLDGKLYSAPAIQDTLSKRASISGDFTQREAMELANVLENPLSVRLKVDEVYEVGPAMAADARESSVNAALLGASLVVAFMLVFYFMGGVIAVLASITNVVIVLGVLASLGATLTLPGVAALLLTLGMGVDANILIFERIREESLGGKSIRNAVASGFEKVTSTIVDANVTTLITAAILIWLGHGPVKGFGVTLAIGITASVFSALVVTRFMVDFLVFRLGASKLLGVGLSRRREFDFLKFRKPAFAASWTLVLIGVVAVVANRDTILGIDFTGGDEMTVGFEERVPTGQIMDALDQRGFSEASAVYQSLLGEEGAVLKVTTDYGASDQVLSAMQDAFPEASFEKQGVVGIGAAVSAKIQRNAIISVAVAFVGIMLYVALRFEVGFGVGAVSATIHDVLMTIGVFVLLGGKFNEEMLAAILMVVGYSINDTIVVFDRVREELQLNPGMRLREVINFSINRVLSRSILTSVTTLLAAFSLYIFGAGVIHDFALVFIIGIVTGTFSSMFIASPIFYWWHRGDRRHVEARELTPKQYEWESSSA